jgi:hypothetical protein
MDAPRLLERARAARVPGQQFLGGLRDALAGLRLTALQRVEVGDHDPRLAQIGEQVRRDEVELALVVLLVLRPQHAQPVADGQARCDQ